MAKIKVDRDKCIGCGSCMAICSNGFQMKDGKASPVKEEVEELTCEDEAMAVCPVGAISIE